MKIVFFGSSEFSLYSFQACLESGHEISLVVTTPPKPQGRGLIEQRTPIHQKAIEHGLAVTAPVNLKSDEALQVIKSAQPDLFVVASYGKMIPTSWLSIPRRYAVNVHPSLLPKYRGAAPINWPILNGDEVTGMSLAEVTSRLDAGDIFYQKEISIQGRDAEEMTRLLGQMSGEALKEIFLTLESGKSLRRTPQIESDSTYARKLNKTDSRLNLENSAEAIVNQIRGLQPWPGAAIFFQGQALRVLKASHTRMAGKSQAPGTVIELCKDQSLLIQTGSGYLRVERVIPPGKKEMSACDFARGRKITPGFIFEPWPDSQIL